MLKSPLYGVPSSPAFELLPDRPSEITHLVRPSEFSSSANTWHDGLKLRAGIAVDSRPFVDAAGTLSEYQRSYRRRLALRTVVGAGSALAVTGTRDLLTAFGVRIPLMDAADVRLDTAFQRRLADAYAAALRALPPSGPFPTDEEKAKRAQIANEALRPLREAKEDSTWNAARIDVGLAGSALVRGGEAIAKDSLSAQRGGAWLAAAFPFPGLGTRGQLTFSAQSMVTHASLDTAEHGRHVVGARAVLLATRRFNASAEYASVWSRHRDAPLDDRWDHVGVLVEWMVPELKGWLGVAYGGDQGRRADPGELFALRYAIYPSAVISK